MNVDQVLLSVQERDKWQRRVAQLQLSLSQTRDRRQRLERRLRRIRRELARLAAYSDAILSKAPESRARTVHATADLQLRAR